MYSIYDKTYATGGLAKEKTNTATQEGE